MVEVGSSARDVLRGGGERERSVGRRVGRRGVRAARISWRRGWCTY